MAACRLSIVVGSGSYSSFVVCGLLIVAASFFVWSTGSRELGLSSYDTWA